MPTVLQTLSENYIEFEGSAIRAFQGDDGSFWFNLRESAKALGYREIGNTIDKVDRVYVKSLKQIKTNMSGHPSTLYVRDSGFYELMSASKLAAGKRFRTWVFGEVLPSIQVYGAYIAKKEDRNEMTKMSQQIKRLEKQSADWKRDTRKRNLPKGGTVYAIDFSDEYSELYRIGKTVDAVKRLQNYDTHSPHNVNEKITLKTPYPDQTEKCLKLRLERFKVRDRKDIYQCSLATLKKVFTECVKTTKEDNETQVGGSANRMVKEIDEKIAKIEAKRNKLEIRIGKLDKQIKEEMEATRQEYAQYI